MEKDKNSGMKNFKTNMTFFKPYLFMFARLSGWVFAPVLIGIYAGRWLDEKYKTKPLLFLISVGISFFVSMAGLMKNAVEAYKNPNKYLK